MDLVQLLLLFTTLFPFIQSHKIQHRLRQFGCHEKYSWQHPDEDGGESPLYSMCKDIVILKGGCYETCVLTGLGILQYHGKFGEANEISNQIRNLFKQVGKDTADTFAKEVVKKCLHIAEETKDLPCKKRTRFYDCVNQAASCK